MGYLKIPNLYKDQTILMFRECFALEKIHGTSANVSWRDGTVNFFSGGEKHERFVELFEHEALIVRFEEYFGQDPVTVYGEAYGGKMQGMSATYGKALCFTAFDVKVGNSWLAVPQAHDVVTKLGLEFVPYEHGPTDLKFIDAQRDRPSVISQRRGVEGDKVREGVVLRPVIEVRLNDGSRVIAKHKCDAFRETRTKRRVEPDKAVRFAEAEAIAFEWVTPMRLAHVLDKLPDAADGIGIERTGEVIKAMIADVIVEAGEEIEDSHDARKAMGKRAAQLFKNYLNTKVSG